jgi:Ca2+-binding RTX toxin-like protein
VQTSVTYVLGTNLENLTLLGTAVINGTGNSASNRLTGNAAANVLSGGAGHDTLDGKAGADRMSGGAGDDIYVVDSSGDAVVELLNEGSDMVQSSISYTLGENIEHLTLLGSAGINGAGNSGANRLTGNAASNVLWGGAGNDTLNGGEGNDRLHGGMGEDIYMFGRGYGLDTIRDDGTDGAVDTVLFSSDVVLANLAISQMDSGRDIVIALSATDRIVLDDRLINVNAGADRLRFADGTSLSVNALVQAMSTFGVRTTGELSLARPDVQQYLAPLLAAGA